MYIFKRRMWYKLYTILLFFTFLFNTLHVFSQKSFGIGISKGLSQYRGDLNEGAKGIFSQAGSTFGIQLVRDFNRDISMNVGYMHGTLQAYDGKIPSAKNAKRGLHFKSPLDEFSIEFKFKLANIFTHKSCLINPYIGTGIVVFKYNPKAELNGTWYELHHMHTEGQTLPNSPVGQYYLINTALPLTGGLNVRLSKNLELNFELSARLTSTDYLDDVSRNYYNLQAIKEYVSPEAAKLSYRAEEWSVDGGKMPAVDGLIRGNPTNNDWYVLSQVGIVYKW
jgi:hypothetical protein